MHGGTISAWSEGENQGAVFTLRLPLVDITTRDSRLKPSANGSLMSFNRNGSTTSPRLNGVRILVIDDEPDARELIRRVLVETGAFVCAVSSVREALEMMEKEEFHALISDIGMPEHDGYELIRNVRTHNTRYKEIPAIAVSAFAQESDRKRSLEAGFHVHLAKPIDPYELTAVITKLISNTAPSSKLVTQLPSKN
jgi:CheY-like chemotaxis protein